MLTRRVEQTCLLAGKGGGGTLPGLNCCLKVSPCHMGFPVRLNETQRRLRCVRFNWGLIGTGNGLGHLCYQSVHLPSTPFKISGVPPWTPVHYCALNGALCACVCALVIDCWKSRNWLAGIIFPVYAFHSLSLSLSLTASVKKHYGKWPWHFLLTV